MSSVALSIELDVAELATTRFAVSALSETVSAVLQLRGRYQKPENLRWFRWAADELEARPLALPMLWPLLAHERPSWPEFLLPAPGSAATTLDEDLAAVRRTTARQVRASLGRVFGDQPPPAAAELAARPAAGLRTVTGELRAAHDRLVAPHWTRIRAVLDADVVYRAGRLAAGGAAALFADLHPDVHWDGRAVVLATPGGPERIVRRGPGGLVLMPVVLGPVYVSVKGNTSTQTTLRYPARGVGALWSAGTRPPRHQLAGLIGRPRAELLEALRTPGTTTELARAAGVTPGAVSQHLTVLHASGLVARERVGRAVLYLTTELGIQLLDASLE